jgi:hypothetical protein
LLLCPVAFTLFTQDMLPCTTLHVKHFPALMCMLLPPTTPAQDLFLLQSKKNWPNWPALSQGILCRSKAPFQALEITQKFNPEDTQLIFVRSQKDADKPPRPGGVKKNGEPCILATLQQKRHSAHEPTRVHGLFAHSGVWSWHDFGHRDTCCMARVE